MIEPAEWLNQTRDLYIGRAVTGVVTVRAPFGSFVDIGAPKPALIHLPLSAEDDERKDPAGLPQVGELVQGVIAGIDDLEQRIILSLRQAENNLKISWDQLLSTIPIGSRLEATIISVVQMGVILDMGSRFRCFLPQISDSESWMDECDSQIGRRIHVQVVGFNDRLGVIKVRLA